MPAGSTLISVVIPVLNEADRLEATLNSLQAARQDGHEVIVVDGGSSDATVQLAHPLADKVLHSPLGRAIQMNVGAREARHEILLFLHADCQPPPAALQALAKVAERSDRNLWGRFDIRLSGASPWFRLIAAAMNWRSRISSIATGDQGIFVGKSLFNEVGGYDDIPLMEDVALCRKLRRRARPRCLSPRLMVSSRRWEQEGLIRTVLLMWRLRFAYFMGADPRRLARQYCPERNGP